MPPRRSGLRPTFPPSTCAAPPITTRANTTSRYQTSTMRCAWVRRTAPCFTTAATPGAAKANIPRRSRITTPRSNPIRNRRSPGRTAASRGSRSAIWRAKGDYDRAIADGSEAIRLAKNPTPNIMTPPGSVAISAYINRALSWEAKGDYEHARADFSATLQGVASDAASKANQATARVRLSLLSDPNIAPRDTASSAGQPAAAPSSQQAASAVQGRRMALVIGNGAYTGVKALPNPRNDARAVAKSLRDIGFTVSEGVDLDRAAMQTMTRNFLREAARAQIALVYYAGHGVQIGGRNYL